MTDPTTDRPTTPADVAATSAPPGVSGVRGVTAQSPSEGPSDRTTLTAVLDAYHASGFTGDFSPEEPGAAADRAVGGITVRVTSGVTLRCDTCSSLVDPREVEMHSIRRLEGASDPADMVAVVALTCPLCGTDGLVVLGYGPMASAVDADVFVAMRDRRDDDVLPPDQAPAETERSDDERRL